MHEVLFFEIALVIVFAGLVALLFRFLRQPMMIAYLVTGLLVGPSLLNIATSSEVFGTLSSIGIAFLLFLVGLHLNWRNVKDVGRIAVLAGLIQVIFTTGIGYVLISMLGFDPVTSIIASIAFAFSSTIIIVKLLTDKEDLERFYGRISIGVLIVQDLIAMLALLAVGAFGGQTDSISTLIGISILKLALVIIALFFVARHILPHVMRFAAHSQELLFLTAVAWCFGLAGGLTFLGFGIETGALLAGISLAGTEFRREIDSKIKPLRDFFVIIFFIVLGTQLSLVALADSIWIGVIISLFILIGNPLILLITLRVFGYHPRTGFLVGVTMAQVSEFSFILLATAFAAGLIGEQIMSIATIVAMITIGVSTYLIKYNEQIYEKVEWMFKWMETVPENIDDKGEDPPGVILFGYHNLGATILPAIKQLKEDYLVVDFNPAVVDKLSRTRTPHIYGDMGSRDFLSYIRAPKAKLVISTIPDVSANVDMIEYLKMKRSRAAIVVTAKSDVDAKKLYIAGATFVIVPTILGGELFGQILDKSKLKKASWKPLVKKQKKIFSVDK
ncbi:sodium:proton exchanger [Candidatus Uhrbacteria bacterium]|jgi:Kef-type K+ transport system membrane component KefB|nr:sodium:proton exchanger [Candidatus Uhrbacteria bacterium]